MPRYYKHGVEAVRSKRDREEYIVRPVHPDGAGYAAITYPIERDLAQQWATVANFSRNDWELIAAGLALLDNNERARALEVWASAQGWEPNVEATL